MHGTSASTSTSTSINTIIADDDYCSKDYSETQQIADAEDLVETESGDLAASDEKKASPKVKIRGGADLAGCGQDHDRARGVEGGSCRRRGNPERL